MFFSNLLAIAIEQIHVIVIAFVHFKYNKFHLAIQINRARNSLSRRDSREIIDPVSDREVKNHTLLSNKSRIDHIREGVPPSPPRDPYGKKSDRNKSKERKQKIKW